MDDDEKGIVDLRKKFEDIPPLYLKGEEGKHILVSHELLTEMLNTIEILMES